MDEAALFWSLWGCAVVAFLAAQWIKTRKLTKLVDSNRARKLFETGALR